MQNQTLLLIFSVVLIASACGGGNDAALPAATDAVPDSASQSVIGMKSWLTALSNDRTEVKEPLDVARFTPAAPDDTEPEALQ